MQINHDVLQQIEDVIGPIEKTLKIMLEHKNLKADSKTKILTNLESFEKLRENYRNDYRNVKNTSR